MGSEDNLKEDFKEDILREQVRLVMRQVPTMQVTSFIVAFVLCYAVRDIVSRENVLAWLLMVLGVVLGRNALYHRFCEVRDGSFAGEQWKKSYLILAGVSGVIWGASAFAILPSGNPGLVSLFVLVMAGLSAATTLSHSAIRLASAAWSGPVLLLYAARCVLEGTELGYTTAALILLYLFTILRSSFAHHGSIVSAITLRLENLELLDELQKANDLLSQDIPERERTQALATANALLGAEVLERQKIEEELRRESAFREAIIANATEGLCVWHLIEEHPYVRFTVWNRSAEEITGYSMEEINRLGWVQAMYDDPETQVHAMEAMLRVSEGCLPSRLVRSIRRADGQKRTVVISSARIQLQENRGNMIVLLQDITELKGAVQALRQSETQLRGLVENIRVGILILKEGDIVYQNPEQERLLGRRFTAPYPLTSLVEAIHSEYRQAFDELCEACPPKDSPSVEMVLRLVSPGCVETAETRWVSCHCSAIEYQGEEANLIHMLDITQLKDLERLVMQREKMASLGHVAAGIAHEIRNPLSGINVYLDAIQDCYQDPECAEDVLRLIQEAQATSNKIESVIRRVLDFSRPTELRMRLTSINEAIEEAVKLAAASLRKARIRLDLGLDPGLPRVYADAQLMEQVMINLISNASNVLKTIQGERCLRISTGVSDGHILARVEDSGPGVPAEVRERVFEPFFTTRSQGMGIGLGICKRIVADHRGEIYISTSSMGGAQFNVAIPVEKRSEAR